MRACQYGFQPDRLSLASLTYRVSSPLPMGSFGSLQAEGLIIDGLFLRAKQATGRQSPAQDRSRPFFPGGEEQFAQTAFSVEHFSDTCVTCAKTTDILRYRRWHSPGA